MTLLPIGATYTLSADDAETVRAEALARVHRGANLRQLHGIDTSQRVALDMIGTAGEFALSALTGAAWTTRGKIGGADVGAWMVRSTTYTSGRLLLHDTDEDERVFCLMTVNGADVTFRGSILARHGKDARFWTTTMRNPCYAVPQRELLPLVVD